ncbi:8866_t:CDS:2, partial [Cetraspora pellucida]
KQKYPTSQRMSQTILDGSEKTPSISISDFSKHCQFNCDKLIWNFLNKKRKRDTSTLKVASKNRSEEIKKYVIKQLKKSSIVIDHSDTDPSKAREVLRNAQVGQFLYQLKFKVLDELYDKLETKGIKLKNFVPDFIEVIEEDGEKRLMIWDAKASKEARVPYQFQVASYVFLLKHMTENLRGISMSRLGGLFLSSSEGLKRQTFPSVKKVSWHFNARCKTCEFVDDCRKEAEGTMAMIPYLSTENASYLKRAIRSVKNNNKFLKENNHKSGRNEIVEDEPDYKDLANYLSHHIINDEDTRNINRKIKQIIKYDNDQNSSPYLDAHETGNVQFIGTPTVTFPQKTDHNLVIVMSSDPFVLYPFGWAICLYTGDGKIIKEFRYAESVSQYKQDEALSAFIIFMNNFMTCLEETFEYLSNNKSRACIFVYSEQEKIAIQDSLIELMTLNSDIVSNNIQQKAAQCLFNLFEDCSLLLAVGNDDSESSKLSDEWREFPRLIVLEHSVKENIAINVPGFYSVIDVWEQMVKPVFKDNQELLIELEPHIFNIDLEDIHSMWASGNVIKDEINKSHLFRSEFVNIVIQAYYTLLNKSTNNVASILIFSPQVFTLSKFRSFNHHYLGKLYFFKQFEAITTCSRIKLDRFKDFVQGEAIYGIRVKFDKIIKENSELEASFIVLSESFS